MKSIPPSDTRIIDMDASTLSHAIHEKHVSCREVMNATLDRIAELNPHYNAIVSLQDADLLLAQADERDFQLAQNISMGWMHGMPCAHGLPSSSGVWAAFASSSVLTVSLSRTMMCRLPVMANRPRAQWCRRLEQRRRPNRRPPLTDRYPQRACGCRGQCRD